MSCLSACLIDCVCLMRCRTRKTVNTVVVASSKKVDIGKQGLNSVKNETVRKNLQGVSENMNKKGWVDSQGRKGKVGSHHTFTLKLPFFWKSAYKNSLAKYRERECTSLQRNTVLMWTDTLPFTPQTSGPRAVKSTRWEPEVFWRGEWLSP